MRGIKLAIGLAMFAGILGLVLVGALEGGVRIKERFATSSAVGDGKGVGTDPTIHAPPYTLHEYVGMYNEAGLRLPNVTTNSRGFRGMREVSIPKAKGMTRIFVIGGSAAVGYNASNDSTTMPAQLETYLKAQLNNPNIEVFNAACSGFSSTQDLVLLSTEIMPLQPDLVIAMGGGTDLNISMYPDWRHGYHEMTHRLEALSHPPWHDHSRAVQFIKNLVASKQPTKAEGTYHPEVAKDYADNVLRMANVANGEGVPFVNVLQPALLISTKTRTPEEEAQIGQIEKGGLAWGYQKLIVKLYPLAKVQLAKTQLPRAFQIDASDAFAGTKAHLFSDAFHLTDEGYRVMAEQIGRFVVDKKLIPGAAVAARSVASQH